jgi:hypothetical protein
MKNVTIPKSVTLKPANKYSSALFDEKKPLRENKNIPPKKRNPINSPAFIGCLSNQLVENRKVA